MNLSWARAMFPVELAALDDRLLDGLVDVLLAELGDVLLDGLGDVPLPQLDA